MPLLIGAIRTVLEIVSWLIIIDVLLSLFPVVSPRHPLVVVLRGITRPITTAVGRLVPPVRPIRVGNAYVDLSPFIVLLAIMIVESVLALIPR